MNAEQKIREILADEFRGKAVRSVLPDFIDLLEVMLADLDKARAKAQTQYYASASAMQAQRMANASELETIKRELERATQEMQKARQAEGPGLDADFLRRVLSKTRNF